MPLIIKRQYKSRIKKRHCSLFMFILIFTIAIYRACYIMYHYRIIKLSTFTIDKIELKQDSSPHGVPNASSDFQIELSANFSKSYCPLNLEFIEITASMFTGDLELCSKYNAGSLISLSIDKLRLDKKTPLKFSANLKVCKFHLESTLLDLLGSNFTIQVSFYVRARFCYLPLYFFKNMVRKRLELVEKGGSSIDSNLLAFKVNSSPRSSIQVGLRRRFFTETLGEHSNFVFNVGCLKLDFSGCVHKSILVSSFDTSYYCAKGGQAVCASDHELEAMAESYIPGAHVDGCDEESMDGGIAFFFITIPLHDGESIGKMVIERLKNQITYLKIDKVSILHLKMVSKKSMVHSLNDVIAEALSTVGRARDPSLGRAEDERLHFTEIRVFKDMYIVNSPKSASPSGISSVFVNSFRFSNRQVSCNIGLSREHGLYSIIKSALLSGDLKYLYENFCVESRCVVGGKATASIRIKFMNAPVNEEFFNVVGLVATFQDDLEFVREDLKDVLLQFINFNLNGRNIIILNLFEIMIDYTKGIFLKQDDCLTPVYIFPLVVSRMFRLDHELRDSLDGKFVNVHTKFDTSTYYALGEENIHQAAMNGRDCMETSPVGRGSPGVETGCGEQGHDEYVSNSFIKFEVPNFHVSVTNSFMKLRSKFLTSNVFLLLEYSRKSKKLVRIKRRGIVEIQSAVMFKKLAPSDCSIDELMLQEEITVKINQLMTFRILPSSFISSKEPMSEDFVKFLPFLVEFDVVNENFTSFMSSAVKFRHISKTDGHVSDYLKCIPGDFPRKHGWNPESYETFKTNEPTRHLIKNVFHARKASHAIGYFRYVPLMLDATDVELVFVYTGDNLFMYFGHPFSVNIRLADPSIYDDPDAFTREFIRESRLYRLVDFLVDGIIRKIKDGKSKNADEPAAPEDVDFSLKLDRREDNCYKLSSKIVLAKRVLACPDFIYMNLLGSFSICSKLADAAALNLSLDSDGHSFVIELKSSWGNGFGCEPIELVPRMLGKELNHVNLNIFELVDGIRKYANFIIENPSASPDMDIFNYLSPESVDAFFDSGHDQDFIFKDGVVAQSSEACQAKPKFDVPWMLDIEVVHLVKKSFGFGLEFKLWPDELFACIGEGFSNVFDRLPCRVKPSFVDISLNLRNLFEFKVENSSQSKVFGLQKFDIIQKTPIRIPICSKIPAEFDDEDGEAVYARLRSSARTSLDQYVDVSLAFYLPGHSTFVYDILHGGIRLSHSLYENNFYRFLRFADGHASGKEGDKPYIKFRLADLQNSFIDFRLPFSLNFVGEPTYFILGNNTVLSLVSKLKGPFLDPKVAVSGYNISLPISSRRLAGWIFSDTPSVIKAAARLLSKPVGSKEEEMAHQLEMSKLKEKVARAKPDRRNVPSHFKKQYELITKHGDDILHCRGMVLSGAARNQMMAAIEKLVGVFVPGENQTFFDSFASWAISSYIDATFSQNPYVDYDSTINRSFAENEFGLNDEDIKVLRELLCTFDFST